MLITISPAKKMNLDVIETPKITHPRLIEQSQTLLKVVQKLSEADLANLMKISPSLSALNVQRYADFGQQQQKPAAYLYDGDTYTGLDMASADADGIAFAQNHLRILSGLYGLLRPLDLIEPHRLEMGSRLQNPKGKNLYAFWREDVSELLRLDALEMNTSHLVNCASEEYFSSVDPKATGLEIITPRFFDIKDGEPRIISFWAKQARGAMARYIIDHQLRDPKDIAAFDSGGYAYDPSLSTPQSPAFVRDPA